jgi:ferredoxin--NADP+ reductase
VSAWISAEVIERRVWAEGLVSLTFDAALEPFEPGQWTNVALELAGERVRRAYSLASAPGQPPELLLSLVPGGRFTPHLMGLAVGNQVELEKQPQGFFTLRWLPPAKELWMVATGTGLAPYLSMLRHGEVWQRFERVVLVHGARQVDQLAHRSELEAESRLAYVPAVSREPGATRVHHGRVTTLLESGELERAAGTALTPERSHVLLCGNPEMISEMGALLEARGLRKHRQRKPGHVTTESYW